MGCGDLEVGSLQYTITYEPYLFSSAVVGCVVDWGMILGGVCQDLPPTTSVSQDQQDRSVVEKPRMRHEMGQPPIGLVRNSRGSCSWHTYGSVSQSVVLPTLKYHMSISSCFSSINSIHCNLKRYSATSQVSRPFTYSKCLPLHPQAFELPLTEVLFGFDSKSCTNTDFV